MTDGWRNITEWSQAYIEVCMRWPLKDPTAQKEWEAKFLEKDPKCSTKSIPVCGSGV